MIFLRGLLIGLSIAAPVGPIGVLCIRRTLAHGRWNGFVSGLGAATADALYGCIAAFGLTFLAAWLVNQQSWLSVLGGGFLCYLGIRTFLTIPPSPTNADEPIVNSTRSSLLGAYFSTLFLTLTNPMTILSFTAIFVGLGIANQAGSYFFAFILVLGVFLGSTLWWLLLSSLASALRLRFMTMSVMRWVNWISGSIIFTFGGLALVSGLRAFYLS